MGIRTPSVPAAAPSAQRPFAPLGAPRKGISMRGTRARNRKMLDEIQESESAEVIEGLNFTLIDAKGAPGGKRLVIELKPPDARRLRPPRGEVLGARIEEGVLILEWQKEGR